jgi:hypothetical protein
MRKLLLSYSMCSGTHPSHKMRPLFIEVYVLSQDTIISENVNRIICKGKKVKSLCLTNYALGHEGVRGEWMYTSIFS